MDCSPPGSSIHGILQVRILLAWSGLPFPSPGDRLNTEIEPASPVASVLLADSLPAEPPGEPKNTGVGSLSLLQRIFLTRLFEPGSPALQVDSLPAELPAVFVDTEL